MLNNLVVMGSHHVTYCVYIPYYFTCFAESTVNTKLCDIPVLGIKPSATCMYG